MCDWWGGGQGAGVRAFTALALNEIALKMVAWLKVTPPTPHIHPIPHNHPLFLTLPILMYSPESSGPFPRNLWFYHVPPMPDWRVMLIRGDVLSSPRFWVKHNPKPFYFSKAIHFHQHLRRLLWSILNLHAILFDKL